nr:hypothetical protein CFP56_74470 [Quercus suber]
MLRAIGQSSELGLCHVAGRDGQAGDRAGLGVDLRSPHNDGFGEHVAASNLGQFDGDIERARHDRVEVHVAAIRQHDLRARGHGLRGRIDGAILIGCDRALEVGRLDSDRRPRRPLRAVGGDADETARRVAAINHSVVPLTQSETPPRRTAFSRIAMSERVHAIRIVGVALDDEQLREQVRVLEHTVVFEQLVRMDERVLQVVRRGEALKVVRVLVDQRRTRIRLRHVGHDVAQAVRELSDGVDVEPRLVGRTPGVALVGGDEPVDLDRTVLHAITRRAAEVEALALQRAPLIADGLRREDADEFDGLKRTRQLGRSLEVLRGLRTHSGGPQIGRLRRIVDRHDRRVPGVARRRERLHGASGAGHRRDLVTVHLRHRTPTRIQPGLHLRQRRADAVGHHDPIPLLVAHVGDSVGDIGIAVAAREPDNRGQNVSGVAVASIQIGLDANAVAETALVQSGDVHLRRGGAVDRSGHDDTGARVDRRSDCGGTVRRGHQRVDRHGDAVTADVEHDADRRSRGGRDRHATSRGGRAARGVCQRDRPNLLKRSIRAGDLIHRRQHRAGTEERVFVLGDEQRFVGDGGARSGLLTDQHKALDRRVRSLPRVHFEANEGDPDVAGDLVELDRHLAPQLVRFKRRGPASRPEHPARLRDRPA